MKTILLSIMLAVSMVGVSLANETTIATQGTLSESQKADLAAQAAKMVADNANEKVAPEAPGKTAAVVKQWAEIGTAIGTGLAASAKELGIAANEFAQTPVGKFTVFLIAWHFIGGTILHVFFALLWFFTTLIVFVWLYRRASIARTVTYYDKGEGPNGARKVVKVEPRSVGDNLGSIITVGAIVAVLIFVIMLWNL